MSYKLILDPDYVNPNEGEYFDSLLINRGGWIYEYARSQDEQGRIISMSLSASDRPGHNWETARDFIVTPDGTLHIYSGTSEAIVESFRWDSGNYIRQIRTLPNWSTVDNSSSGGIDYYQNYLFVTDMKTSANDEQGLIRFSITGSEATRFAQQGNFIDLAVGLDNLVYGLEANGKISVYNPDNLELVRSLTLEDSSNDYRGIAVNQHGEIFSAAWNGNIYYFNQNGNIVDVNDANISGYFAVETKNFNDINISPDGKELMAGNTKGVIVLLDIAPEGLIRKDLFGTGGESAFVSFGSRKRISEEQNHGITVSISDAEVLEGDLGESTWMDFTVSLSEAADETVSVDVRSHTPWEYENRFDYHGFAQDNDFVSKTETISFAPGEIEKTFSVEVIGDLDGKKRGEYDERIYAEIDSVVAGNVSIGDGVGDGIIIDNEAKKPQLSISSHIVRAVEGEALEFTVSLDRALDDYVTVKAFDTNNYRVGFSGGYIPPYATKGEDYLGKIETLTFAPGETSKIFKIDTIADSLVEGDEQFPVKITTDNTDVYLYDSMDIGIIEDNDLVIGEVGHVKNVNSNLKQIQFQNEYDNPVVIVSPLTRRGGDPAIARITDIQTDGFKVFAQEPTLLRTKAHSGGHTNEDFTYMVVEAGTWTLPDGRVIEAGLSEVDTSTRTKNWDSLELGSDFNEPVVISSVQTYNNEELVRLRQRNGDRDSINLALEKEEALLETNYQSETVGYIAVESTEHSLMSEGMGFTAGETERTVDHRWQSLDNSQNHPYMFASINSYYGGNSVGLRYRVGSLILDEDTSLDYEIGHTKEDVAYLGFDNLGLITVEI